jgi:tRNA(Ile)-lysidine synthase
MVAAEIRQFFVKEGIKTTRIVTAVSAGADSTALLVALAELRCDVVAAHVNHHLRGADSDADEAFLRALCATYGVSLHVADGTLDPERVRARGVEAAAREVRYAHLLRIRGEVQATYVATAHQKNDQAETVLMRLLSGSGIAGLRGIHPVRGDGVIRPLLGVTRAEIDAFLAERGIAPRHDHSNDDPRFLRNRVRAVLRDVGGIDALANVAAQARAQWPILERAIDDAGHAHAEAADDRTLFRGWPDDVWLRGALLQRHIRRLDPEARDFDATRVATQLDALKRVSVTGRLELLRVPEGWLLRRLPAPRTEDIEVEITSDATSIEALGTTIHIAKLSGQRATGNGQPPRRATVRAQPFQLPKDASARFIVRNRRSGDRFQPLGMDRAKKLKDFLIDRKIAAEVRDRLPLLVWNGEIVWVAGVEISERFKVTGDGDGDLYEVWTTHERDQSDLHR